MPTIMITFPTYIGCRTNLYRPPEATVWPVSTVTVAAA